MGQQRVELNFENSSIEEVLAARDRSPKKKGYIRFQAIYLLYIGYEDEEVEKNLGISTTTLYRWRILFNSGGVSGLTVRRQTGRRRKIPRDFAGEYLVSLIQEPNKSPSGHWTGKQLHGFVQEDLKVTLGYSTLIRYLHEQNLKRLIPRRYPGDPDPEKRQQFIEKVSVFASKPNVELHFADESGFEGDPKPRQTWAKRGSRLRLKYFGDHVRSSVVGSVNPATGELFSLIVPYTDTTVFQLFVDRFAALTKDRNKKIILVLDNASWHKSASIKWHHIEPLFLPPYSPDLNPIEQLWNHLKRNYLANLTFKTFDALDDKLATSLIDIASNHSTIQSLCSLPNKA